MVVDQVVEFHLHDRSLVKIDVTFEGEDSESVIRHLAVGVADALRPVNRSPAQAQRGRETSAARRGFVRFFRTSAGLFRQGQGRRVKAAGL